MSRFIREAVAPGGHVAEATAVGAGVPESVAAGADVILSSADKLIGASQGGIVLGKAKLVEAVRKSPLARILRVGKLTLAALEATLALFLDEAAALEQVPTLRMLRPLLAWALRGRWHLPLARTCRYARLLSPLPSATASSGSSLSVVW